MRPWLTCTCEADRIVLHLYTFLNEKRIAPITYSIIYTHNVWYFSLISSPSRWVGRTEKEGQTCSFFANALYTWNDFFSVISYVLLRSLLLLLWKKNDKKALLLICTDPPVLSMLYCVYIHTPTHTHVYTHTFETFN